MAKRIKIDPEQRDHYCESFCAWADLMEKSGGDTYSDTEFAKARRIIEGSIHKSCLLDRMIYCGEKPSKTPCPVHKGRWSGIHFGWPETYMINSKTGEKKLAQESPMCREWYDQGCRCFQHSCGCTTGWQPDEHCGCLEQEENND